MIKTILWLVVATLIFVPDGECTADETGEEILARSRDRMILTDLKGRDINNRALLRAIKTIPREQFVPPEFRAEAYSDHPLSIGQGQTISQPYIVALMTQSLKPESSDRVLEIGTGSGYQAAVLSLLVEHVYSIEIVPELAQQSSALLTRLGYQNVTIRQGDGYRGWPTAAPFDKIIVTAAAETIPPPLEKQLREGGIIIMPVGENGHQQLLVGEKQNGLINYKHLSWVRFVPLTGEIEKQ